MKGGVKETDRQQRGKEVQRVKCKRRKKVILLTRRWNAIKY